MRAYGAASSNLDSRLTHINSIGVIPCFLGGGIGIATGLTGIACDNMISAKLILADGRLVHAIASRNLICSGLSKGQVFTSVPWSRSR